MDGLGRGNERRVINPSPLGHLPLAPRAAATASVVNLWAVADGALVRRPYLANCLTAATLFGAGDLLAQQGIEGKGLANHDIGRTFRLTVFGGSMYVLVLLCKWTGDR